MDKDLESIQQVRDLVAGAGEARKILASLGQEELDRFCLAVRDACVRQAESLAKMAAEETGFGVWQDKVLKNLLGSHTTWESIKNLKVVGVLSEDRIRGITEIGVPMGIVAALIPSTNPTSTVMYKTLIAIKSGNAIVISPHPNALRCILETVRVINGALAQTGAPPGLVGCISLVTGEAVNTLLRHRDVGIILATGGEAMVRAAYSSGNPAIGVGPGNGPAFIERSADISQAVRMIMDSKTFDNGTICASEQSVVADAPIAGAVLKEFSAQGAYILNEAESAVVKNLLFSGSRMNPKIVGRTAGSIAGMAGIQVPPGTRVLISPQTEVSRDNPYSREKLCPVLGFYTEDGWENACKRCIRILENEGAGHTMVIHSKDEKIIREFAMKKAVSRLLVNTPGALGGVGATTNLAPALTLGCGAVGKSATSDNITPLNLINIRRVAAGCRSLDDIRREGEALLRRAPGAGVDGGVRPMPGTGAAADNARAQGQLSAADVEAITELVMERLSGLKPANIC
ncbi:MAG: acetaldehyde dehydrogenase (acetylating) [Spirochaetaceae bacterium]|jgi:acetaldehyde dehydrogenase (acetylating)|nr:acetaldehyde dehydrogenase (acetylating) [Spirochaetaceae bacterium]